MQHTRLPCLSPSPRACSNSCQLSWWCHPTISSSVISFSSCLQSFPASGSFPVSQFFPSGVQSIGASAAASVPPMNSQDWFPLGLTGLISLLSKGFSRVFLVSRSHLLLASLSLHLSQEVSLLGPEHADLLLLQSLFTVNSFCQERCFSDIHMACFLHFFKFYTNTFPSHFHYFSFCPRIYCLLIYFIFNLCSQVFCLCTKNVSFLWA